MRLDLEFSFQKGFKLKVLETMAVPKLLTINEVAEYVGCSARHISRQVSSGKFPAPVKIGHLSRWKPQDLYQWVEDGGSDT